MIDSAMIELGYREIFGCKFSPQWKSSHGNSVDDGSTQCGINEKEVGREDENVYENSSILWTTVNHHVRERLCPNIILHL